MRDADEFYKEAKERLNNFVNDMKSEGTVTITDEDLVLVVRYYSPETKKLIGTTILDSLSNRAFIIKQNCYCICINYATRTIVES